MAFVCATRATRVCVPSVRYTGGRECLDLERVFCGHLGGRMLVGGGVGVWGGCAASDAVVVANTRAIVPATAGFIERVAVASWTRAAAARMGGVFVVGFWTLLLDNLCVQYDILQSRRRTQALRKHTPICAQRP